MNSLLHKIYKARYFPNGEFFAANLGVNPSHAYRGIWDAKKKDLMRGKIWRIRDGLFAKI